ncbi:MAG: rRNA pseudouridine synthase [Gemmatimonadetes bacterium]|nr:rRNA pseudouridine synthase [Gemmatimonadota bacterium]
MRLQKFLSRAGVASRRRAERLIEVGRVRVNGEVVSQLGATVDASRDVVEVDGRRVQPAPPVWIALHKPRGYVTTRHDPQGRPTVYDLLPPEFAGLFYIGRLDRDTEGLLLLTNHGDLAHRLMHPRYQIPRVYEALLAGQITPPEIEHLLAGVPLEDGIARAEQLERLPAPGGMDRIRLTIREGRKREVRRMLATLGHRVRRLLRRSYGPVRLGRLRRGTWRRLTPAEVAALLRAARA